jgi:hypothetical protein
MIVDSLLIRTVHLIHRLAAGSITPWRTMLKGFVIIVVIHVRGAMHQSSRSLRPVQWASRCWPDLCVLRGAGYMYFGKLVWKHIFDIVSSFLK